MQDRYAGDVGDFSKFAITIALHEEIGGSIGVIWYRFPDEKRRLRPPLLIKVVRHSNSRHAVAFFGRAGPIPGHASRQGVAQDTEVIRGPCPWQPKATS